MLDTLKTLCEMNGTSGREDDVREYILERIEGKCKIKVDALGNILAFKEGRNRPKNKVMISAHMDEVGFIVTYITDEGYLRFDTVGGIDEKVIVGRTVTVGDKIFPALLALRLFILPIRQTKEKYPKFRQCILISELRIKKKPKNMSRSETTHISFLILNSSAKIK